MFFGSYCEFLMKWYTTCGSQLGAVLFLSGHLVMIRDILFVTTSGRGATSI